jgi:CheY-like chemotaxis protein
MQAEIDAYQPRKTVFLVDDEPDITSVIKMGLEQKGFVVHAFNDPKKALQELRLNGKDCTVVLSDIKMPDMSGFELCRIVKQTRPDLRVILMTAFEMNQSEVSRVMPATMADGYIQKPISLKKLKEVIDEFTSRPE